MVSLLITTTFKRSCILKMCTLIIVRRTAMIEWCAPSLPWFDCAVETFYPLPHFVQPALHFRH